MKYKMGSLVTEATGKIGGMVAMGRGSGGVMRVSTVKRKKHSLTSYRAKVIWSQCIVAWQTMSEANRIAWNNSKFSEKSGFNLFMLINASRFSNAFAILLKPPVFNIPKSVNIISAVVTASTRSVVYNVDSDFGANSQIVSYVSKPFQAFKTKFNIQTYFIRPNANSVGHSYDISAAFRTYYNFPLIVGQYVVIRVIVQDKNTYVKSEPRFLCVQII